MQQFVCSLVVVGVVFVGSLARPENPSPAVADSGPVQLAQRAISTDPTIRDAAIRELRAAGPAGLDALFAIDAGALDEAGRARLHAAMDAVGAQRDCHVSRLYWYTDFEQAKNAAQTQGKPILSLRLLGKLTDEYSCANSRFFRAALYANADVSEFLRDRFVLHWSSERPVPAVTIDFGDGRQIRTTLTGNSIHYVLDVQGRPVDALPGLYGPAAFRRHLEQAATVVEEIAALGKGSHESRLISYHQEQRAATIAAWHEDLLRIGIAVPVAAEAVTNTSEQAPSAVAASRRAFGKSIVELPTLAQLFPTDPAWLTENTTGERWEKLAGLHAADARLDRSSRDLMRTQQPQSLPAIVESFESAMALDTIRNEYLLHRQIHEWFAERQITDFNGLNARVYADLFLTPASDPWLGLLPQATYTGLANNGVIR